MALMTMRRPVLRLRAGRAAQRPDTLAVEEPLQVRLGGHVVTTILRTPGADRDLVAGWLAGEDVVASSYDIAELTASADELNTVDVTLAPTTRPPRQRNRHAPHGGHGVCGNDRVVRVRKALRWAVADDGVRVDVAVLSGLRTLLRTSQSVVDQGGGMQAAGLFDRRGRGVAVREDVDRLNAVDKIVGTAMRTGTWPLSGHVLQVSGRASFEIVQRAVTAGVPVLCAVSAPSSLAVELAEECGLTLVGFVRGRGLNVYTRPDRVRVGPMSRRAHSTEA